MLLLLQKVSVVIAEMLLFYMKDNRIGIMCLNNSVVYLKQYMLTIRGWPNPGVILV